jgi:membrane protease YdiL (CAAX protease family)
MRMSGRTLAWFLGSLLLATWALQVVALEVAGDVDSRAMVPWLVATMFMPTLWSIVYLVVFNRSAWKLIQFRLGNPIYLLMAALIPAGVSFGVLAIAELQGWAASSFFSFGAGGANVLGGPWVFGSGAQGWGVFVANVVVTALWFASLNSLVAFGEEFGWRGLLQHHLIERLGLVRGVGLLGYVWGIWHLPVNLAGWNYPDTPVLGALVLFPIKLIAVSFIMAWLTLRARSFWPAVLMHGSGNGIGVGVMSSLTFSAGMTSLGATWIQIGLTIAIAILCLVLASRHLQAQRLSPLAGEHEAHSMDRV